MQTHSLLDNCTLACTMQNSWTAEVELNNGQHETIWYTAWPMSKNGITKVLSISSDYPKHIFDKPKTKKLNETYPTRLCIQL